MGKRNSQKFERKERDFYGTVDPDAVKPLIPFIRGLRVAEPCAGNGDLATLLEKDCFIVYEADIEPQNGHVLKGDATDLDLNVGGIKEAEVIVTNPPFSWPLLKPLLDHLPTLRPTWLLLPADCFYNKRMSAYVEKCSDIVSIGRLYWMENKIKGVDNYAWGRFIGEKTKTTFHGRGS